MAGRAKNLPTLEATITLKDDAGAKLKEITQTSRRLRDGTVQLREVTKSLNRKTGSYEKTVKDTTQRQTRFRAELLSTLFVGMQVSGFFEQYTSAAKEMSGETEILTTSLAAAVMEWRELSGQTAFIDKLSDFADDHPIIAGAVVDLGKKFGDVLSTVSQVALGVSAWKIAFPEAFAAVTAAMPKWMLTGLAIGVSLFFAKEAFDAFREGDILGGIADTLIAAGSLLALKNPVAGAALITLGVGLHFVQTEFFADILQWLSDQGEKFLGDLRNQSWFKTLSAILLAIGAAAAVFFTGGAALPAILAGAAVAGVGATALAEGGIVTRPTTALIGEAGPEAVIPLNQLGNFAPNVTINASVANNIDMSRLANTLSNVYSEQLRSQGIIRRTV